jgi:hypothetical protein
VRAAEELSRAFFGPVLETLQRTDERGALLREMLAINEDPPGPDIELAEELESAAAALSEAGVPPGPQAARIPWSSVTYAFAWDREPRADVVVDLFLPFEHARSLEELVGLARGQDLVVDESAVFFSDEQVAGFRDGLARIPDPAPRAPERVARLRRLVELAASDPQLALATRSR